MQKNIHAALCKNVWNIEPRLVLCVPFRLPSIPLLMTLRWLIIIDLTSVFPCYHGLDGCPQQLSVVNKPNSTTPRLQANPVMPEKLDS